MGGEERVHAPAQLEPESVGARDEEPRHVVGAEQHRFPELRPGADAGQPLKTPHHMKKVAPHCKSFLAL